MSRSPNIVSRYAKRTVFNNRGRSILTLIGIIVATMMFSIVASAYVSSVDILHSFVSAEYGCWHVEAYSISSIDFQRTVKDPRLNNVAYIQEIGVNPGTEENSISMVTQNGKYKYFIGAMNSNCFIMCNLNLIQGRMPEKEGEAIISLEMFADDHDSFELGKEIQIDSYARYSEGHKVMDLQNIMFNKEGIVNEELYKTGTYTFTIVGYFAVPEYAHWKNIAADTILTVSDSITTGNAVNAYYALNDAADYQNFTQTYFEEPESECLYNKDYIRMENSADDTHTRKMIGLVMTVTLLIIVLLAVMLIYNSFSTSSSERMRAICLLKSVGATRKQVRQLMLKEAFYYSVIGIPIGIGLGQGASILLFHFLQDMSRDAGNYLLAKEILLEYRLGLPNTIGPAILSIVTILIAVLVPMIKVSRVAPIEAVRANEQFDGDQKLNLLGRLSAKITEKVFGFAGGLSMKNYFRYRKRYFATVISIVVSILMIIFANMFVKSFASSIFEVDEDVKSNQILYEMPVGAQGFNQPERALYYEMAGIKDVTSSRMIFSVNVVTTDWLTSITDEFAEAFLIENRNAEIYFSSQVIFVEDSVWRELCERDGIDPEPFLEYGSQKCLVSRTVDIYDPETQGGKSVVFLADMPTNITIMRDKYTQDGWTGEACEILEGTQMNAIAAVEWRQDLAINANLFQIFVPMSRQEYYGVDHGDGIAVFQFTSNDPRSTHKQMKTILENNLYSAENLQDLGVGYRAYKAVDRMAKIVLYGYVAMLSLMCFLNVVMTVISNIIFRRKEYILLMSVGMSRKTLFRMVLAESLIYFSESILLLALIFFLPLILAMLIYSRDIYYYVPIVFSILIVLSHLLVVVGTTAIGLRSVMKDEIIEGIRKEYY